MDFLTQEDLTTLIALEGEWCISIFMPTVRTGPEVQQNPIRFRNLLRRAEDSMSDLKVRVPDAERLLEPARAMLHDPDVWRNISDGLAVFVVPDQPLYFFRLPLSFDDLVVVKGRLHIKPLLPLLSGDGQFFVLALSQDRVRLLEGTRDSVDEVSLSNVPEGLADALQIDPAGRQALRAVGASGKGAVIHGYGQSSDTDVKQIGRYFRQVDRGLRELLAEKRTPLILAGVDYLLPIYREVNSYPHLVDQGLTGNPDTLSAKDLHRRAWEVIKPRFEQEQADQRGRYDELAGRKDPRVTASLKQVVLAAFQGRVATLFVTLGVQRWGTFDPDRIVLHIHPQMRPGDQDLLDLAAVQTLANGGTVYALDRVDMPEEAELAAIFRY